MNANEAGEILKKTNLSKSFLIRKNESGKQIVSYLECGEVKHTEVPRKKKNSDNTDEIIFDLVSKKSKDWCYPVTPNVPYDWNEAHFKRPRGREHGRRGAVRRRVDDSRYGGGHGEHGQCGHGGGGHHDHSHCGGACGDGDCCHGGGGDCAHNLVFRGDLDQRSGGGDLGQGSGAGGGDHGGDGTADQHHCDVCTEVFGTKERLYTHVKVHRVILCEQCSEYIPVTTFYTRHRPICTPYHAAIKLKCDVESCSFSTPWINELNQHKKLHVKKPFICSCGKFYKTLEELQIHKIYKHSSSRPSCQYCDQTFKNTFSLNRHIRNIHLNPTIRNSLGWWNVEGMGTQKKRKGRTYHHCHKPECKFKTKEKKRLERHIRVKHYVRPPKLFKCEGENCKFESKKRWRYDRHVKSCDKYKVLHPRVVKMFTVKSQVKVRRKFPLISDRQIEAVYKEVTKEVDGMIMEKGFRRELREAYDHIKSWYDSSQILAVDKKGNEHATALCIVKDLGHLVDAIIAKNNIKCPKVLLNDYYNVTLNSLGLSRAAND